MTEDPSTRDWREMFEKNPIAPAPGIARLQESIANLESKHRYTYPSTDAGDVPAGTKFDHPMKGTDDPFENALADILFELNNLMLKKHQDYGPLNIALAPGGAINGLRVRMHDKLARINNLVDTGAEPNNESLEDSFKDLANYGIIGLMVLRGHWPGTDQ